MRQQRVSLHTECSLAFIMANPKIKVKRSSVEGKVPAVTQLERGELAVNSYDGKVYILKDQFSVGIATTTHTLNPWNEPNGVGAVSYTHLTLPTNHPV